SYIPQGNTLFSGSIEENLKLGSQNTTPGDLETAIRAANAWDFIEKLPQRFSTIIGERGIGLSAGQAQRLAIARAFLHKAPILVLDEATSELDADTEINIIQALQNLNPKRTCIIITHRPAALAICDRILKLENGKILECRPSYSSPSH
ncbi:MAG: ABC transporter ATP-binding protein/permease, partial [Clostridia bacterium]|nr:ABC transporter ATP-binding protein/permease [Clostridia bacterium]